MVGLVGHAGKYKHTHRHTRDREMQIYFERVSKNTKQFLLLKFIYIKTLEYKILLSFQIEWELWMNAISWRFTLNCLIIATLVVLHLLLSTRGSGGNQKVGGSIPGSSSLRVLGQEHWTHTCPGCECVWMIRSPLSQTELCKKGECELALWVIRETRKALYYLIQFNITVNIMN